MMSSASHVLGGSERAKFFEEKRAKILKRWEDIVGGKTKKISEEQVAQITERVGAQLQRKDTSAMSSTNRPGRWRAYVVGGASGVALALAAPLLRPAMRSTVKGGILIGRYARQVGSSLKEQFEDIVAEAEADLDQERAEGEAKKVVEVGGNVEQQET
jgi:hypothetical protein